MKTKQKISRKQKGIQHGNQKALDLGASRPSEGERGEVRDTRLVVFNDPAPERIFIGDRRLDEFLRHMGFEMMFLLRGLIRGLDLEGFESKYRPGGRRPYHPAGMIGLILFGVMEGKRSLRELEELGRSDVRAWWLTGGVMPDHTVLCRFINENAEALTEGFFEDLTRQVMTRTSSSGARVAVDGTVIQAAASRYKRIKREAAEQAAAEARERAIRDPDDAGLRASQEKAERVAEAARERSRERERKGRKNQEATVSPTEPDAVVQPLKSKAVAPSYKGSVVANEDRIITAKTVHPSSETAVLPELISQAARTNGMPVRELMADAGYHSSAVISLALEEDIDLLCPQGRTQDKTGAWEKASEKMYLKNRFRYDEHGDVYICPAGQRLDRDHEYQGNEQNPAYVLYRCAACEVCPEHARCTKAKQRAIKRYEDDEIKEAMQAVMRQPAARRRYGKRKAMVEPVHGEMKNIQGLHRFLRLGLLKVRLEYSLNCSAHNLRRLVSLAKRRALQSVGDVGALCPRTDRERGSNLAASVFSCLLVFFLMLKRPRSFIPVSEIA